MKIRIPLRKQVLMMTIRKITNLIALVLLSDLESAAVEKD